MTGRTGCMAFFVLCGVVGVAAYSREPTESAALERGEHVARLVCSACHVVAADQEFPPILRPPAPSFGEIANRPNISLQAVQQFVLHTHWDVKTVPLQMPNPMLPAPDATAVARYVLSLRRH
jgi:mono/diheme cytochrome c family protein